MESQTAQKFVQSGRQGGTYDAAGTERFMRAALEVASRALQSQEVPVACVIVFQGQVVAEGGWRHFSRICSCAAWRRCRFYPLIFCSFAGSNETNATLNPTRHAEFLAIESLQKPGVISAILEQSPPHPLIVRGAGSTVAEQTFFRACDLFVTVEPCIMYVQSVIGMVLEACHCSWLPASFLATLCVCSCLTASTHRIHGTPCNSCVQVRRSPTTHRHRYV